MANAIGMVEYKTVASGMTAADLMVKTAEVDVIEAKTVCPGKFMVLITGDLSSVKAAVDAAIAGVTCSMMTIRRADSDTYSYEISHEDIFAIANQTKCVPDAFINQRGNGITDECLQYLLPLIKGERYPEYKDGLPVYFTI